MSVAVDYCSTLIEQAAAEINLTLVFRWGLPAPATPSTRAAAARE